MKARISRLKRSLVIEFRVFRLVTPVVGSSHNASGEERYVTILITAINIHGKLNMFMHSLMSRICCLVSVGLPLQFYKVLAINHSLYIYSQNST